MQAAAAFGHYSVVEVLLANFRTMDIPGSEVMTAFREACKNGHRKVVKLLLANVHTIEISSFKVMTAFQEAWPNGHHKLVELLLTCHVQVVDLKAGFEEAALHGRLIIVNTLIDYEEKRRLAQTRIVRISRSSGQDLPGLTREDLNSTSQVRQSLLLRPRVEPDAKHV